MEELGKRIRKLRKERQLSRQELCDDESRLSIRQLMRIENNQSLPSLSRLQYIAERLGLPVHQLLFNDGELSESYMELKYLIQRHSLYDTEEQLDRTVAYLEEVLEHHYHTLPGDEQFVVDCWQALMQLLRSKEPGSISIIDQHIDDISQKSFFRPNDLPFLKLFFLYLIKNKEKALPVSPKLTVLFDTIFIKLLKQSSLFPSYYLTTYAGCIYLGLIYYHLINNYTLYGEGIALLNDFLHQTWDFQKKPLILMLEWKSDLFVANDFDRAMANYQKAMNLLQLLDLHPLKTLLTQHWQDDMEKSFRKRSN